MSTSLKKRAVEGRRLTTTEVDGNWTLIEGELNKNYAATATLSVGNNTINHAKNRKPIDATFFTSAGVPLALDWKRDPTDQLNKIIVTVPAGIPSGDRTNIEINITTKSS